MCEEFSFGVLAYNQEAEVELTLNSILYQITKYGHDVRCNLIITDDCSRDSTVKVIEKWLGEHPDVFHKVIKRYNTQNKGTVDNYLFILSHIRKEPFKVIAADDLISGNNIFAAFDKIGEHTLYAGFRIFFNQSGVFMEEKHMHMQFFLNSRKFSREQLLRLFRKGYIISTPQTLFRKNLFIDSNAETYIRRFRLFEDNPTWYSMIKNTDDIQILFSTNNVVLYRISDKSVSNSTHANNPFREELDNLYKDYIRDGSLYEKLYFRSAMSRLPKVLKLPEYATRLFYFRCSLYARSHHEAYMEFKDLILTELEKGENYYRSLQQ